MAVPKEKPKNIPSLFEKEKNYSTKEDKPKSNFWASISNEWKEGSKNIGSQIANGLNTFSTSYQNYSNAFKPQPSPNTNTNPATLPQLPPTDQTKKEEPTKAVKKGIKPYLPFIIGGVVLLIVVVVMLFTGKKEEQQLNGYRRRAKRKPKLKPRPKPKKNKPSFARPRKKR